MSLATLIPDIQKAVADGDAAVVAIEKLVNDTKAGGSLTVDIADVEAAVVPVAAAVNDIKAVIGDL